jgi:hypothetical protein
MSDAEVNQPKPQTDWVKLACGVLQPGQRVELRKLWTLLSAQPDAPRGEARKVKRKFLAALRAQAKYAKGEGVVSNLAFSGTGDDLMCELNPSAPRVAAIKKMECATAHAMQPAAGAVVSHSFAWMFATSRCELWRVPPENRLAPVPSA